MHWREENQDRRQDDGHGHADRDRNLQARVRGSAEGLPPALRVVILSMTVSSRRSSKVLAVSVSPEAAQEFNRLAGAEGRNKSELFREMLRVYRIYRDTGTFESLQRYGAARARRLGIRDERDVERLIEEARGT